MDQSKTQLIDKLKSSSNVLVTVSRNPSVDQLAALLGLTLFLNKQGKHAAAVFSGQVPSTLEFLKPEATIEKNTDSLRDFIIALDKNKADKLRYKVEDDVVRIFITPYKTSITEDDFEFSQGDFNVDLVVAIGVTRQEDLDQAITAHGRILHDAAVASINVSTNSELGSINWLVPESSSLSELVTQLVQAISAESLDEQIATALLTGIVAETNRFSNEKTTSQTMSASAALMSAGANQQLVASKLQEGAADVSIQDSASQNADGSFNINHVDGSDDAIVPAPPQVNDVNESPIPPAPVINSEPNEPFELPKPTVESLPSEQVDVGLNTGSNSFDSGLTGGSKLVTEPPELGGELSANTHGPAPEKTTDPLTNAPQNPTMLEHNSTGSTQNTPSDLPSAEPQIPPAPAFPANQAGPASPSSPLPNPAITSQLTPPPPAWVPPSESPDQTIVEIEEAVNSPHLGPRESVDDARAEVDDAIASLPSEQVIHPDKDLNSQPLGIELHPSDLPSDAPPPSSAPSIPSEPTSPPSPNSPPPVPPPLPPNNFGPPPATPPAQ